VTCCPLLVSLTNGTAPVQAICSSGGDVLNVGFGMGLVDTAIQKRKPKSHTIVEAHPGVYEKMLRDGESAGRYDLNIAAPQSFLVCFRTKCQMWFLLRSAFVT
jgi:hypothetical protein